MGKVLVFLTHPLNPHPGGTRDLPMHAADQRDSLVTIARNRHFLPAFLNLVVPALDPSIKDSDKTERDLNSVDIVITVLDQLAAVPNGCAQDVAGTSELLVLELKKGGMIGLLTSLAALTERREFKRIVPVLMDLVFNMVRGQDGEALLRSHLATLASNAKKQQEQQLRGAGAGAGAAKASSSAEGSKKTSPTVVPKAYTPPGGAAGAASSSNTAVNKGLPNASAAGGSHGKVGGASTTILLNANGKRPYSSASNASNDDPLKALMKAERDTKAALMRSNGSDRHSRFGIQAYVRSIGTSQVGSAPPPQPQAKEGSAGAEGDENNTAAAVAVNPLLLVPTSVYGPNGQLLNNQYKRVITGFKSDMAGNGIDFKTATASGAGMKQQRFHPNAANNRAAGMAARKGKHDLYRQELFVDTNSGVGAASTRSSTAMNMAANSTTGKLSASYLAASAAGGNMGGSGGGSIAAMAPQDLFADKETVDKARSALYELCLRLLSFGSPVATTAPGSNPTEDDEEDDGAAPPAFSTLAQRIKFLISRDSSDLVREDPLRYLHASAVVLAAHRASETHRVKSQTEEAHRLLAAAAQWKLQQAIKRKEKMQRQQQQKASTKLQQQQDDVEEEAVVPELNEEEKRQQEGEEALRSLEEAMGGSSESSSSSAAAAPVAAAASKQAVNNDDDAEVEPELTPLERLYEHVLTHGILVPGISIEPVLELVDQWSWARCQQMLSSYLDAKQWKAASVVLGHLKELLVFVNTINSGGNEGARRKGQGQVDIDITDVSASSSSSSSSGSLPLGHDVVYTVPKRVIRALDTAHLVKETDPNKFFLALSGNKNANNNSPVSALNGNNTRVVPVERSVLDLDEGEARPLEVLILPWSPLTASLFPSTSTTASTAPLALSSPDCPQGLSLAALRDVEARKPQ
jgi:Timeless protein